MKKIILLTFIFLLNTSAQDFCQLEEKNQVNRIEFGDNYRPNFFTKPLMPQNSSDSRNEATVIVEDIGNMNFDFKTGKAEKVIGAFDAVPSVDGKILTVPAQFDTEYEFLIYDRNNLKAPIFKDKSLKGSYQSVGIVNEHGNESRKVYRVITDTVTSSFGDGLVGLNIRFNLSNPNEGSFNLATRTTTGQSVRLGGSQGSENAKIKRDEYNAKNLKFRDYEVTTVNGKMEVKPLAEVDSLCPNLKSNLKLPMLSKDGNFVSVYNYETGTTQILRIKSQLNSGNTCEVVKDLGFASTKVEFNADSTQITFATDAMATAAKQVIWNQNPDHKKQNMNVYVYDLKKNELTRISNNGTGSAYYPAFSRDNTITYLDQTNTNGKLSYALIQAKIPEKATARLPSQEFFKLTTCDYTQDDLALMALGKLWYKICSKVDEATSPFGGFSQALALDPKQCTSLVSKYWEDNKKEISEYALLARDEGVKDRAIKEEIERRFLEIRNLSVNDLLNVCPKVKALAKKPAVKMLKITEEKQVKDPLKKSCVHCHSPGNGRPFLANESESVKRYKDQAIQHVKNDIMPMGAKLTPTEKARMIKYLEEY